jgi:hypothetical protein
MLDQSILPIDPWSRKNFSKGTFMTKKPEHLDSETDETERIQKLEGLVDKMVPKELRMAGFIWPELTPTEFAKGRELEVFDAALRHHLAQGGDPQEIPSAAAYARAVKGLEKASVHINHQALQQQFDAHFSADVKLLLPLLKDREQSEQRITFARAVMITTGNHDRKDERPGRWIQVFREQVARAVEEMLQRLLGGSTADECKKVQQPGGRDAGPWGNYDPDDLLTLPEFAKMFFSLNHLFPRGRELSASLGRSGLEKAAAQRWASLDNPTRERLITELGTKKPKKVQKVLGPVSGQPQKSAPRKPKKRRTKTA